MNERPDPETRKTLRKLASAKLAHFAFMAQLDQAEARKNLSTPEAHERKLELLNVELGLLEKQIEWHQHTLNERKAPTQ